MNDQEPTNGPLRRPHPHHETLLDTIDDTRGGELRVLGECLGILRVVRVSGDGEGSVTIPHLAAGELGRALLAFERTMIRVYLTARDHPEELEELGR